jgi:hypothetical protein
MPQHFMLPTIDPFSLINQELLRSDASLRLDRYAVPQDLPLVVQADRFDRWKDPQSVSRAPPARATHESAISLRGTTLEAVLQIEQVHTIGE